MIATAYFNPFPGLRPFRTDEDYLFFGREGQSEEILRRLRQNRFVSVVGTSGSGKSSLIRAGLLPHLFGGFMSGAGSHWRVAVFRPGSDPIGNLANALNDPGMIGDPDANEEAARKKALLLQVTLRRSGLGLLEAVRLSSIPERDNLLVVVDQFEELFRFANAASAVRKEEDAAAFVKLLLEAGRQSKLPVYVVITMRSDFIGDCARFRDLPEAVTAGLYLIPRMTREQRRAAIEGPVQVGGAAISRRLVNRLLNDGGDDPDLLPSLQHALMRTCGYWEEHRTGEQPIDIDHYVAVGGISEALSRHAEEAYAELPGERQRGIAKRLFQSLTEKGPDNREVRRPTKVADIAAIAEAEISEVTSVIEYFRREGRSFLMPPPDIPLEVDSVVDISHESLIRGWERLKSWVEQETESARMYRRLAETAALHAQRKAGLWHDPDLSNGLAWREKEKPNAAWAKCYHPDFDQAIAFLEQSRQRRDEELADQERRRREELRKVRLFAAAITGLFVVAVALACWAWSEKNFAQAATDKARSKTQEAQNSAAAATRQQFLALQAEAKAKHALEIAEAAGARAEAEKRAETAAREGEKRKALEAVRALLSARNERNRADANSKIALEYAGDTLNGWQSLSDAITSQHEAQDFYEKLLTGAENVPKKIMENSPDNPDAMVFWVIDTVGIPDLHYRQGRIKQAQDECGEHEQIGQQWARDKNDFKHVLAADLLSYTAKTRMKLGNGQAALSDANLAASIAMAAASAQTENGDRSWRDLSVAYSNAGEVQEHYSHLTEALEDYQHAVATRAKIANPSLDSRHALLLDMREVANIQVIAKRKGDALATYKDAVAYAEASLALTHTVSPHPVKEQALVDAASVYSDRGDAEVQWQQNTDAEQDFKLARSRVESVGSKSEQVEFELSVDDERLGNIWNSRANSEKDPARQADYFQRAVKFHQSALEERIQIVKNRNNAQTETNLGIAEGNLGRDYVGLNDSQHGVEHYKSAVAAYSLAADLDPSDESWRQVSDSERDLARLDEKAASTTDALADYRGSAAAGKKVAHPGPDLRTALFSDLEKIADFEGALRQTGALDAYTEAIGYGEKLAAGPENPDLIQKLFWLYVSRGDLERQRTQFSDAEKDCDSARSQALRLDQKTSDGQSDRAVLDECSGNLLNSRAASEKNEDNRKQLLRQAVQFHQKASDQFRRMGRYEALAIEEINIGLDYRALNDLDKARQHYQSSVDARKEAARVQPSDQASRELARAYQQLGSLEEEAYNYAAARTALDSRIAILEFLIAKSSSGQEDKALLASSFGTRSWVDLFLGDFQQAIKDADKGLDYDKTQMWISINKAHGYFFSGRTSLAAEIYLANANKPAYPEDPNSKTFGAAVLDDFDQFRKHPNPKMRLAALASIDERLKNKISHGIQQAAIPQSSVRQ